MSSTGTIDPVDLVKELVDKIGIRQTYAIAKSMREELDVCTNNNCEDKTMTKQEMLDQKIINEDLINMIIRKVHEENVEVNVEINKEGFRMDVAPWKPFEYRCPYRFEDDGK